MEIRKLTKEDFLQYEGVCQSVFFDLARTDIREREQMQAQNIDDPSPTFGDKDAITWGAFDTSGNLVSGLAINPYTMRMNGHNVKMGGIALVATLPEARGQGLVNKIMEKAFPEMIDTGQTFSYLFPFSYSYYRMFGYEICNTNNNVKIPIAQFKNYPYPQNIQQHKPSNDITPFVNIYETFAEKRNLSFVRSQKNWEDMLNRDHFKNLDFTYLNYDETGIPNAYVLYKAEKIGDHQHTVRVNELCWSNPSGLHSIFGFFGKLSAEYDSVSWNAPSDINVHALFPESYAPSWQKHSSGMNRILSVPAALKTLRAPGLGAISSGKVVIEVTDNYWHANTGSYLIEWDSTHITKVEKTSANPDMSTSIQTLAQLVTGYLTPAEAMLKMDTSIYSNQLLLDALFPRQLLYMYEGF